MAETAKNIYDDEEPEVTSVRGKTPLNMMHILGRLDDRMIDEGEDELRKLAKKDQELQQMYNDLNGEDIMKMIALMAASEDELQEMVRTKRHLGLHDDIPELADTLFRLTGDEKYRRCLR